MKKGGLSTRYGLSLNTQSGSLENRIIALEKTIETLKKDDSGSTIDITKIFETSVKPRTNLLSCKVKEKTWKGLTSFNGRNIWTDGENIYYSSGSNQYILNKTTSVWKAKTWKGLTSFYGQDIWTDGENIYCSTGNVVNGTLRHFSYILDKTSFTWNEITTWGNLLPRSGDLIWTDKENIYSSCVVYDDPEQYIFNKTTNIWEQKQWTGTKLFQGYNVWSDSENIYYSSENTQYVLNKTTSTWQGKIWKGLTSFDGQNIWSNGEEIYYSDGENQYVLNKTTSTWQPKVWNGITSFDGANMWTDGENIYYSNGENQYNFIFNLMSTSAKMK